MLPQPDDFEEYRAIFGDPASLLEAARAICREQGVPDGALTSTGLGTNIVFRTGHGHILKLAPPLWPHESAAEARVLRACVEVDLGVRTPILLGAGEVEGWSWLLMTELEGEPAGALWSRLPSETRARVAGDVGALIARWHDALPADLLEGPAWDDFLAERLARVEAHHRRRALHEPLLSNLPGFLDTVDWSLLPGGAPRLLNADITEEHVLLIERDGRWRLSGLFDFADAMVGHSAYDLLAPGLLIAASAEERRALLLGFGLEPRRLTSALSRSLTGLLLLHRFASVTAQTEGCTSWDAAVERLWGLQG